MAKRERVRKVKSSEGSSSSKDADTTAKGPPRNVQSIEFKPEQWDAVVKAAIVEGHPPGAWVRAAALEKARRMGLWDPLSRPGPKPEPEPENGTPSN